MTRWFKESADRAERTHRYQKILALYKLLTQPVLTPSTIIDKRLFSCKNCSLVVEIVNTGNTAIKCSCWYGGRVVFVVIEYNLFTFHTSFMGFSQVCRTSHITSEIFVFLWKYKLHCYDSNLQSTLLSITYTVNGCGSERKRKYKSQLSDIKMYDTKFLWRSELIKSFWTISRVKWLIRADVSGTSLYPLSDDSLT